MNNYKRKYVSFAVSILLFISGNLANAQAAPEKSAQNTSVKQPNKQSKKEDTTKKNNTQSVRKPVEEVMVTGIRRSLTNSLSLKKDALHFVDAISAEDVGKLPDVNVAEAMQRIAGVTVNRNRGDGQNISVRGLTGNFNVTTLNGRKLATDSSNRDFNYDVLASGIISTIEISKTPKAEYADGGIGAIIEIKTVRPLNTKGTNFTVSVENVYEDLAQDHNPKASLFYSTNNDDTFGLTAGLIYAQTSGRYDYMSIYDYYRNETLDIGGDGDPSNDIVGNMPDYVTYNTSEDENERLSVNFAAQWRPRDDLDITFDALYSTYDVSNMASGISLGMSQPWYDGYGTWTEGSVDSNGNIVTLTTSSPFLIDLLHIEEHRKTTTQSAGINIEWVVDDLTLIFDLSHSSAENQNGGDNRYVVARATIESATYDNTRGGNVPDMIFSSQLDASNGFGAHYTSFSGLGSEDEVNQFDIRGSWTPEITHLNSLDFGISYTGQTKSRENWRAPNASAFSNGAINRVPVTDESLLISYGDLRWIQIPQNVMRNSTVDGFLSNEEGNFPRQWAHFDLDALYGFYQQLDPVAADMIIARPDDSRSFSIAEDVFSTYLQANIEGQLVNRDYLLNIGGRYVETRVEANGFRQGLATIERNEAGEPVGEPTYQQLTRVTKKTRYHNFLPSLNFRWNVFEDIVFRVAASKVISRPELDKMSPYESISSTGPTLVQNTKRVSNPGLKPFTAKQVDISMEWYFSELGAVTAALYYKDVENFVSEQIHIENIDGYDFRVYMPENNDENSLIQGAELAVQQSLDDILPSYLSGFGFQLNYTYSDTNSGKENARGEKVGFLGMSKNSYNAQLYYEKNAISTRLAYNYRNAYLQSIHSSASGYDNYADGTGYLDFNFNYDINDNIAVFTSVKNVLDEGHREYRGDIDKVSNQAYWGRTINVGVTGKF